MSIRSSSAVLFSLAITAGLAGCSPSETPPASLYWDVPPPTASTNAVLVESALYLGELVAEATQRLRCTGEPAATARL